MNKAIIIDGADFSSNAVAIIREQNELDLTQYEQHAGMVTSTGLWATNNSATHQVIPLDSNWTSITIVVRTTVSAGDLAGRFALLSAYNVVNGASASVVGSVIDSYTAGAEVVVPITEGAAYLYVARTNATGTEDLGPSAIYVN